MFIRILNEENIPFIARKTRVTRDRLQRSMQEAYAYQFVYYLRFDHYKIQSMKVMLDHLNPTIHKELLKDSSWVEQENILIDDVEANGVTPNVFVMDEAAEFDHES
jgi:hypothetical protein